MSDPAPMQKTKVFRVKIDLDRGKAFEDQCKHENTNVNAKLKELIETSLKGQKRYFLAGKNSITYEKAYNMFTWSVRLDSGKEIRILNNLSDDFLKNLKTEIEHAFQERNDWVHQSKDDSVEVPKELVEEGK